MSPQRAILEAQQAALVAALTGQGPTPLGFDAARLRVAAAALLRKRARGAAHAWPALAHALDERFFESFAVYAAQQALPAEAGAHADGRFFVRWLAKRETLPDQVRWETLAIDLRFKKTSAGLRPRTWPVVRVMWLPESRRLAVALRMPRVGAFFWRIPLAWFF